MKYLEKIVKLFSVPTSWKSVLIASLFSVVAVAFIGQEHTSLLSDGEKESLLFIREEKKLTRDVYILKDLTETDRLRDASHRT